MNRSDWNALLDQNEAHYLTLDLHQRNVIAEAGQHIDWLESRKRFNEDKIARLRELLTAAAHALRSYQFGNSATDLAEETANAIDAELA